MNPPKRVFFIFLKVIHRLLQLSRKYLYLCILFQNNTGASPANISEFCTAIGAALSFVNSKKTE